MKRYFTGIGSRQTPTNILLVMSLVAEKLCGEGWTLRSGRAPGADQAFETGANNIHERPYYDSFNLAEIYLPWESFEEDYKTYIKAIRTSPQLEAMDIAAEYHPKWKSLKYGAKLLHARNVHQIYGFDVTKPEYSEFVVCWTKDGKASGGTGQAIRIARDKNIPVYNLYNDDEYDELMDILLKEKVESIR